MGEEIAFEYGRFSDFQGLVTLTLDTVIMHTVMHHSSTSTYIPNFNEIEETFVNGRTFKTHFIRSTWRSLPKNVNCHTEFNTMLQLVPFAIKYLIASIKTNTYTLCQMCVIVGTQLTEEDRIKCVQHTLQQINIR